MVRWGSILFCLLFFSSCINMSKEEREKNIQTQPALTESVEQAKELDGFVIGDWPDQKWWEMFGSKELNALVESALEKNPSIAVAKQRVESANQEAIVASSTLFPLIYFDASENLEMLSKNGLTYALNPALGRNAHTSKVAFTFNYEIDFWSKYKNIARSARMKTLSDFAEQKQVELIIATSLVRTYFALKANYERKNLYDELAFIRKKYFALQSLLTRRALNSKIPKTIAQEKYLEARKLVAAAQNEIQMSKYLLNILRGLGADAPITIENETFDFDYEVQIPKSLNLELVSRRPDLMAAILYADSLAYKVGQAVADFFPNVDLFAFAGLDALSPSKLFNMKESGTLNAKPALSLPIYTAGAIRANVRSKKAMYNEAVYAYNDTLLKSTQDVADSISNLMAVFEKKRDQVDIIEQVDLRFQIISKNYHHGLADLLQVYKTEEELILQKIVEIELVYAQYAQTVALIKSLGGGYQYGCRSDS